MAGLKKYGVKPFVLGQQTCSAPRSVDDPIPTVSTAGAISFIDPYIVEFHGDTEGSERVRPVNAPLPTVDCSNRFGVSTPYLIEMRGTKPRQCESSVSGVDRPVGTITAGGGHFGLCEPYLVSYYGNGTAHSVDSPLPTVTCKDRFGLAMPIVELSGKKYAVDILFRMLDPAELAFATGFPAGYKFAGKKGDIIREIGNAVPCGLARAIVSAAVSQDARSARAFWNSAEIGGK